MSAIDGERNKFWQIFKSVAAGMFGVQSEKNRLRDFKQQSFIPFLGIGIVFVTGLVLILVAIVKVVV